MVLDEHKISRMEALLNAAGGICQKEHLRTHHLHETGRQNNVRHRIALIVMYTSLHNHNRNALHMAEHEAALVQRHRRNRKALDFTVVKRRVNINLICVITQAGA